MLLERFSKTCSVSGMGEEAEAVGRGDGGEGGGRCGEPLVSAVRGARLRRRPLTLLQRFSIGLKSGEYGGRYFSRAPAASMASRTPATLCVARLSRTTTSSGLERRHQSLPEPRQEHLPVHRALEHPGRARPVQPDSGDERAALIVPVGDAGREPLPHGRPAMQAGHPGIGPAFVHEHQPFGGDGGQLFRPSASLFGHVGPVLFGGVQRFFKAQPQAAQPPIHGRGP